MEDIGEGEAAVFKPDGAGNGNFVGRIKPADWVSAAGEGQLGVQMKGQADVKM